MLFARPLICLVIGTTLGVAQGQQKHQDCKAVLIPTEEQVSSDYGRMQAFMRVHAESEYDRLSKMDGESRKAQASYKMFSGEYNDSKNSSEFRQRVARSLENEEFKLNEAASNHYLRRELSPRQIEAWRACVRAGGLLLSARQVVKNTFRLEVDTLLPNGTPTADLTLEVEGGKINGKSTVREPMTSNGSKGYLVTANAETSAVLVNANIPGFTDGLSVDLTLDRIKTPTFDLAGKWRDGEKPGIINWISRTGDDSYSFAFWHAASEKHKPLNGTVKGPRISVDQGHGMPLQPGYVDQGGRRITWDKGTGSERYWYRND